MSALLCNNHLSIDHSLGSYHKLMYHIIGSAVVQLRLPTLSGVSVLICLRLLNNHWLGLEGGLIIVNKVIIDLSAITHVDSRRLRLDHHHFSIVRSLIFKVLPH